MGDSRFALDERLALGSHFVLRRGGIQLRLADDARFPRLLLIPEQARVSELHDLDDRMRRRVLDLASRPGAVMKQIFEADKVNITAIGNIVPQLHIHVVARRHDDDAWPAPVRGSGEPVPMNEELRRSRIEVTGAAIGQELPA